MSEKSFCVTCPHCKDIIIIEQINCKIFRHAILKCNNNQINPHASKQECEILISQNAIYGCGKPFMLIMIENNYVAVDCDYI